MTITEFLKLSIEDQIRAVEKGDVADAQILTYDLTTAFTNKQIDIAGNFFGVISATDANVTASIEFNKIGSGAIPFTKQLYMIRPFGKIFLTSSAQANKTITFIISSFANQAFGVQDNRSQSDIASSLDDIQENTNSLKEGTTGTFASHVSLTATATAVSAVSANASISETIIQADFDNTDYVYLGFDNTTTNTKYLVKLKAGQVFSTNQFKGAIFAYGHTGTQKFSASYTT